MNEVINIKIQKAVEDLDRIKKRKSGEPSKSSPLFYLLVIAYVLCKQSINLLVRHYLNIILISKRIETLTITHI